MLHLVLLKEDLGIDGAGGEAFGSPGGFDQLQLSIGQVLLSNLWQGDFSLWFQQLRFMECGSHRSFGRDCRRDISLLLLPLALLGFQWGQAGHTGNSLP